MLVLKGLRKSALKSGDQPDGMKLSNIGAGKAARRAPSVSLVADPDRTPAARSDGASVLTRLDRTHQRAKSHPEEVFNNLFSVLNYQLL